MWLLVYKIGTAIGYNIFMSDYTLRICTAEDYDEACRSLATTLDEPISFLQAPLYGRLQTASGKDVVYILILRDEALYGCGLGVVYTAPGGLQFMYFPYGPMNTTWDDEVFTSLEAFLKPIAAQHHCAFIRVDGSAVNLTSVKKPIPGKLARTASLQPRAEWVLDISLDDESIWMNFHKHARYNMRLAERADAKVTIYKPSDAPFEVFYSLMQTTAGRDGFGIFDKSYYQSYLSTLTDEEGFVVIATIDGTPAAAGLFVIYDGQAHYVFAGSSNDFRKIAPAYTVIWSAIKESKKRGCTLFNFGGVTDDVKGQELAGVTGFKKRFGGYQVDHQNPLDFVYKRLPYSLFKLYKTLR